LSEWQDDAFKKKMNFPDWDEAVQGLHNIKDEKELNPLSPARARLAYDELLANQLTLMLVRNRQKRVNGRSFISKGNLRAKILSALPFELTNAQKKALKEIDKDMAEQARMMRLLQGDVGSGKTVVAALAMATAVENG